MHAATGVATSSSRTAWTVAAAVGVVTLFAAVGVDYDVTPDASRFVVLEDKGPTTRTTTLEGVLNWFTELAELPRR